MKKTTLTPEQTAELVALRRNESAGVVELARRYSIGVEQVRATLKSHGLSTQPFSSQIAWAIRNHPEWNDEHIATHCQCDPVMVAERRPIIERNSAASDLRQGVRTNERSDTGKRLSATWLRSQCSRGERDTRQIQAMCVVSGLHLTLAEIKASCIAAGLIVPTTGNVHAPGHDGGLE